MKASALRCRLLALCLLAPLLGASALPDDKARLRLKLKPGDTFSIITTVTGSVLLGSYEMNVRYQMHVLDSIEGIYDIKTTLEHLSFGPIESLLASRDEDVVEYTELKGSTFTLQVDSLGRTKQIRGFEEVAEKLFSLVDTTGYHAEYNIQLLVLAQAEAHGGLWEPFMHFPEGATGTGDSWTEDADSPSVSYQSQEKRVFRVHTREGDRATVASEWVPRAPIMNVPPLPERSDSEGGRARSIRTKSSNLRLISSTGNATSLLDEKTGLVLHSVETEEYVWEREMIYEQVDSGQEWRPPPWSTIIKIKTVRELEG